MALKQDLNYQNSALYKFLHKHRERIFKDRTKTPENTALFLLYLGFSLKDSTPYTKGFSEVEYLIENTFITALDILCKDDADEIRAIVKCGVRRSCSSLLMSLHFFHSIDEANIFHYICEEFKTS